MWHVESTTTRHFSFCFQLQTVNVCFITELCPVQTDQSIAEHTDHHSHSHNTPVEPHRTTGSVSSAVLTNADIGMALICYILTIVLFSWLAVLRFLGLSFLCLQKLYHVFAIINNWVEIKLGSHSKYKVYESNTNIRWFYFHLENCSLP